MRKPAKTQWEFGELFAPKDLRTVLTVSELTFRIRRLLEAQVGQVWVTGEITNLRAQASGHIYFTLKDAATQLNCVLFRGETQVNRGLLQDGRHVTIQGEITVYEPRGQYQLRVTQVELEGVGALQAAFERLKQKLQAEGLFAPERKRPIPAYPQRIGVVTSSTGAAIRDVLHVVQRRNSALEIVLAPCRVQGEGAAEEIAAAIRLLNELNRQQTAAFPVASRPGFLDLILITRGGGSLEDLWAFNEEVVARAIFESELPIVSAVGHEIDFTIADFVADLRAATPSAAAEIVTQGVFASTQFVAQALPRLGELARRCLAEKRDDFGHRLQRFARLHPRRRLEDLLQRLDDLQSSLFRRLHQGFRQHRLRAGTLNERLARVRPALLLKQRREQVQQTRLRLAELARYRMREQTERVANLVARLQLLGPEQVLARGYSITTQAGTGNVLRDPADLRPGQKVRTRLLKGSFISAVEGETAGNASA